jgi:hypothetical protein
MPDLDFAVEDAAPVPHCATPTLGLKVRISDSEQPGDEASQARIQSIQLGCQVRIEARRRRYSQAEHDRLFELFGEPSRWSQTVRSLLWTQTGVSVPAFTGSTVVQVPVPCTFDLNVITAKYFHALESEGVPLLLLFSGTIFYSDGEGRLQIGRVSWNKEASYVLPVAVWKSMIDTYYPGVAWLCLRRDVVDRLAAYKSRRGFATWEQALESVLAHLDETSEEPSAR